MSGFETGYDAYDEGRWADAVKELFTADERETLQPDMLERLATAAYLVGRNDLSTESWTRAHQAYQDRADPISAARCAFWLGFQHLNSGAQASGFGWIARSGRLLADVHEECSEKGYIVLATALQSIFGGEPEAAFDSFGEAAAIGNRVGDADLVALSLHGQGRALLRQGKVSDGIQLLDEAMVSITAGEVSALVSGDVYCSVIEACHEIYDLQRAQEWTSALNRWCESQPGIVPYRGTCLVRRSEIMQLHGQWTEAVAEAEHARDRLSKPAGQPALGAAFYQLAELHRLRGDFADAERAYAQASEHGRKPQPGLALLRLTQRRVEVALAAIRPAVGDLQKKGIASRMLAGYLDIALAADDLTGADAAAECLATNADEVDTPFLRALSAQAAGAVLLAKGEHLVALASLERALGGWLELEAPYEAARTRVLIASVCLALGDNDTARMETDAARKVFEELGARPDLAQLDAGRSDHPPPNTPAEQPSTGGAASGLTRRETEVIGLIATGQTNREIAKKLFISEKTVARHVSNIFAKLSLSSRAAATAYAFRNGLT